MESVEETAREVGLRVLNLDVRDTQDRAIQIYEQLGYRRWGTHPNYAWVEGRWVTGIYFYKELSDAAPGD